MRARPIRRRALAAALAVGLAAPFVGLAAQQAQAFGPAPVALACATFVGDAGGPTAPQSYSDTLTLDRSPALPAPGNAVTVTLAIATGPNASGATAVGSATPRATVTLGGTQSGAVALAGPADSYPTAAKSAGEALGGFTATGSYTASAGGGTSLTVTRLHIDTAANDLYCSGAGTTDPRNAPVATTAVLTDAVVSISSIAGQRAGVTGYARPGETATLGGSGWPSSLATGSIAAEVCGIGGAGPCQAAAHTLTTTLAGGMQGTATIPVGATTGARTLRVTAGAYSAVASLVVLGPRTIVLSPAGAAAGTPITVTGANFDPLAAVEVRGSTSLLGAVGSDTADPPVAATATSIGALGATYTYADPATVALVAYETAPGGSPATDRAASGLGAAGGGPAVGDPGTLGMRAFATAPNPDAETIAFTSEVPSAITVLSGPLNRVRVVDRRGGAYGWTLSAAATDLLALGGQTISKALLAVTPTCVGVGAAPPGAVAGPPNQGLGGPVILCAKDTETLGGTTDGEWDVGGTLTLSLPSFQAAASYEGRITITLV